MQGQQDRPAKTGSASKTGDARHGYPTMVKGKARRNKVGSRATPYINPLQDMLQDPPGQMFAHLQDAAHDVRALHGH
eukprot:1161922-Pelagomonas_calceolata.AAC.1